MAKRHYERHKIKYKGHTIKVETIYRVDEPNGWGNFDHLKDAQEFFENLIKKQKEWGYYVKD